MSYTVRGWVAFEVGLIRGTMNAVDPKVLNAVTGSDSFTVGYGNIPGQGVEVLAFGMGYISHREAAARLQQFLRLVAHGQTYEVFYQGDDGRITRVAPLNCQHGND